MTLPCSRHPARSHTARDRRSVAGRLEDVKRVLRASPAAGRSCAESLCRKQIGPPGESNVPAVLLGVEVIGVGVVDDDGVGGLLGFELELLGEAYADAVGAEQVDDLRPVL